MASNKLLTYNMLNAYNYRNITLINDRCRSCCFVLFNNKRLFATLRLDKDQTLKTTINNRIKRNLYAIPFYKTLSGQLALNHTKDCDRVPKMIELLQSKVVLKKVPQLLDTRINNMREYSTFIRNNHNSKEQFGIIHQSIRRYTMVQKPASKKTFKESTSKNSQDIDRESCNDEELPFINSSDEDILKNSKALKKCKVILTREFYMLLHSECQDSSRYAKAVGLDADIDFEVDYFDSLPLLQGNFPDKKNNNNSSTNLRTILLLHGAPGHYEDFRELIKYLTVEANCRIIAPNFPSYRHTYERGFRNSPEERLAFLYAFCANLNLKQFDCVVAHSSAIYTLLRWLELLIKGNFFDVKSKLEIPNIRSVAFFNNPSYDLPPDIAESQMRWLMLKLYDNSALRYVINSFSGLVVRSLGIPNRCDTFDDLCLAASAVAMPDKSNVKRQLMALSRHKIPTYALIGGKDKLIPKSYYIKFLEDLNTDFDHNIKYYDDYGECVCNPNKNNDSVVWASDFSSGGHFTFQRFANQVCRDVGEFITHFKDYNMIRTTKL